MVDEISRALRRLRGIVACDTDDIRDPAYPPRHQLAVVKCSPDAQRQVERVTDGIDRAIVER